MVRTHKEQRLTGVVARRCSGAFGVVAESPVFFLSQLRQGKLPGFLDSSIDHQPTADNVHRPRCNRDRLNPSPAVSLLDYSPARVLHTLAGFLF